MSNEFAGSSLLSNSGQSKHHLWGFLFFVFFGLNCNQTLKAKGVKGFRNAKRVKGWDSKSDKGFASWFSWESFVSTNTSPVLWNMIHLSTLLNVMFVIPKCKDHETYQSFKTTLSDHKIHPFQVHNSMIFSNFTSWGNYHHKSMLNCFIPSPPIISITDFNSARFGIIYSKV